MNFRTLVGLTKVKKLILMIQSCLTFAIAMAIVSFSLVCKATDCLTGAWAGKIGSAQITMEFSEVTIYSTESSKLTNGRYYYKNNLSDLILKQNKDLTGWDEYDVNDRITGHIYHYNCVGNTLTAEWKSKDKKTTLPLTANRTESYSKNRLKAIKLIQSPKLYNLRPYQMLSLPNVDSTSLMLTGKSPGIEKINQRLRAEFISQVEIEIDCISDGRMQNRYFEDTSTTSILHWNANYLTVSQTQAYDCGGAHPSYGESASVYNLLTGKLENTSVWLNEVYQTKYKEIEKETPLGGLLSEAYLKQRIAAGDKADDAEGCLDAISFYGNYLWTNGEKMFFATYASHAASACIEKVALTYKQIQPFLSITGKSAMQASAKK